MKPDRVMMWRFSDAPAPLKALHPGPGIPDWLVLVPGALSGPDIDAVIQQGVKAGHLTRHETPEGDIVYIGTDEVSGLPGIARPAALAATHARRR